MYPFQDHTLPVKERVADLIGRMTVDEKISQMLHNAPAIERLDIPSYNWWNECLHGVGRAGLATVFPQAIGIAATFNEQLVGQVATAISDEARAKYHQAIRDGIREEYYGLTFWTPNINIFRDPRWGRGQETYGEDPYLTGRIAVAFVRGLQGDDASYLKVVATPKHFAVHSGPEHNRHEFDAIATHRDIWETYLPAFEAAIVEGGAHSVMSAYNRINGEPAAAGSTYLQKILRDKWGFDGYVVSDCGGIGDIWKHHKLEPDAAHAAALAVKNGGDLNCGETYEALREAFQQNLISEAELDVAVTRLFAARMRLGMFDSAENVPYAAIGYEVVDSAENRALSLKTAHESMVLLKNDGLLPLAKTIKKVAVIGPNADSEKVLLGNYNGDPSSTTTMLAGISAKLSDSSTIRYAAGCDILNTDDSGFAEALALGEWADTIIFVGGLSQRWEGEEYLGDADARHLSYGDRNDIVLPSMQDELLAKLHALGKPLVLVLVNGSAVAINWAEANLPAIVEAWYPGQAGGTALADVLFGDYNPAGRLPVTFYQSVTDLPDFEDYSMENRTYRYFAGEPLYSFGHGLSYTAFAYANLSVADDWHSAESLKVQFDLTNTGDRAGDEVVQLYMTHVGLADAPIRQLAAFARVHLAAGETKRVELLVSAETVGLADQAGNRTIFADTIEYGIGGSQQAALNGKITVVS